MPYKYRSVDTSTLRGLREAERLHASGWKIIRTGLYIIQFEKRVSGPGHHCRLCGRLLQKGTLCSPCRREWEIEPVKRGNPGKRWIALLYDNVKGRIDGIFGTTTGGTPGWLAANRYATPYSITFPSREALKKRIVRHWWHPGKYSLLASDGRRKFFFFSESGLWEKLS